ncbi:general secretion pathway ATPase protein [Psychromonas sp. CNPT3]|uniref:AAA family ATPase n=1 Tax=Psychromonas sp. CNPT3 TaxID=314282 RepID=UPI00006E507A|nr:AAA family ATPase [Psychromonas sp. CNPT3]AGH82458.1 general secretion pathway ATPase protein [Psychromonas sp. CNPT3]
MYQHFFALKELPFCIAPDPDFLFLSERHKEALAHLNYGLQGNGGFVLLTGEVGTGKTIVCRALLEALPDHIDIACIVNPALNEIELLASVCDEFNIDYDVDKNSLKLLFDAIRHWMMNNLAQGRRAIILIDEAQHLSFAVLEQLRLLTNIESNNNKPLQVILVGQTELQQKLKSVEFRQLAQRITARYHLLPLCAAQCANYIEFRLHVAGAHMPIFESMALQQIYRYTQGVPRLINLLCERCLLSAYSQNKESINTSLVKKAASEMQFTASKTLFSQYGRALLFVILGVLVVFNLAKIKNNATQFYQHFSMSETVPNKASISNNFHWFSDHQTLDLNKGNYAVALSTLYAIWGYEVPLEGIDCTQGERVSLVCFSRRSNMSELARLNYPAILKLNNADQSVYVVLYKIKEDYQLLLGSQLISVSEAWLQYYWDGDLTLLWKRPFKEKGVLKLSQQGENVRWLKQTLSTLQAVDLGNDDYFDPALASKVQQFQETQQLSQDGIVGSRTLMLLMQALNPQSPKLQEVL